MPALSLFHRAPSFDFEGVGARRRRRRQKVVAFVAFLLSLGAVCGVVLAWAVELGFERLVGQGLVLITG